MSLFCYILLENLQISVREKLAEKNAFLVDFSLKGGDLLKVEIDAFDGMKLDTCAEINRYINQHQKLNETDYRVEVSTPGLAAAFKVEEQFEKNKEKEVVVLTEEGINIEGKMKKFDLQTVEIEEIKNHRLTGEVIKISRNTIKKIGLKLKF